jgi:hypothetical protein
MKKLFLSLTISLMCCAYCFAQEAPVQQSQLPREAKTFLKEHFKSKFHHAVKDVDGRVITYEVVLNDNTEIEFDESGRWIEVDGKNKPIPTSFIQKQTLDYVKINNPKESVVKIERSVSGYELELSNGVDLKFDAMGTFVKVN